MNKKLISIVTPCLNEENNIAKVYEKVKEIFKKKIIYEYEHIFIDNKSNDDSVNILRQIAQNDKNVKVILNSRNFGQWASPFYALQQCSGDAAILLVADLQDPVELIIKFLEHWEEGYKTVIGVKINTDGSKISFNIRKIFYKTINKFSNVDLYENFMGFGLYDKDVLKKLKYFNDPEPYLRGIIADINLKVKKVEYTHLKRISGKTKNDITSLIDMGLTSFTAYSKSPLRLITIFAFFFAAISFSIGFFYLIYKLFFWFTFDTGIAPLIILISIFFSFIFIFLGIIAEYLNSINQKTNHRLLVVEEERINFKD